MKQDSRIPDASASNVNVSKFQLVMAKVEIPKNCGKVRVAMTLGNKFTVWNGKQGQHEFVIVCRNRAHAEEICRKINSKEHDGQIDVHG